MDPVSIFSLVIKLVMFLPDKKYNIIDEGTKVTRTELIEVYRNKIENSNKLFEKN